MWALSLPEAPEVLQAPHDTHTQLTHLPRPCSIQSRLCTLTILPTTLLAPGGPRGAKEEDCLRWAPSKPLAWPSKGTGSARASSLSAGPRTHPGLPPVKARSPVQGLGLLGHSSTQIKPGFGKPSRAMHVQVPGVKTGSHPPASCASFHPGLSSVLCPAVHLPHLLSRLPGSEFP